MQVDWLSSTIINGEYTLLFFPTFPPIPFSIKHHAHYDEANKFTQTSSERSISMRNVKLVQLLSEWALASCLSVDHLD